MCGISFIYSSANEKLDKQSIELMAASIDHRGPDARNCIINRHAALGHTRLSIVDIKGGSQPMASTDNRFTIIYNGELYNYHHLEGDLRKNGYLFNTHSDTEVVLNMYIQYGEQCVGYLRGMFSFAIHDNNTGKLFIARDRMGIKPLYYSWDGEILVGASEMKAIFASRLVEPEFNLHSIANYFKYQFSVAPYTPFKHILELEPGFAMTVEPGGSPRLNQYWDLEFPEDGEYEEREETQWEKLFQDALDDSIISHMIGDVPIGAYLSGGIDSATTTYLLNKHYENEVQSYTIRFTNVANDESEISRGIASHINVPNTELIVDDDRPGGYLGIFEQAIYHLEQPQRVAVDIPHFMLSGLVRDKNYKVVYTGDGADEILGGYDCFRQDMIRVWGNEKGNEQQREEFYLTNFTDSFSNQHMRMLLRLHEPEAQKATINKYGCYPAWYDTWQILNEVGNKLLSDQTKEQLKNNNQIYELAERMKPQLKNRHPLNQSLYIETKTRLPGWILWKSDRLSMAHSVEARVPFMDHQLVEFAAQLPPWLKLNGMDEKYILRKIMMGHLPEHPQSFKKRAFYTPIKEWFFTDDKIKLLHPYLSVEKIEEVGIFNSKAVCEMLAEISSLPVPGTYDDWYSLMKLEWGLMVVLTVQILHVLFVEKQAPCFKLKLG